VTVVVQPARAPAKPAASGLAGLGVNAEKAAFAAAVLQKVGIKPSADSISKLVAWANAEGGNWNNTARYNPLNTTLALPGAGNTGAQGNIKVYRSWTQGIEATAKTLTSGPYGGILAALKSGTGAQFEAAVNASPWGTHFPGGGAAVKGVNVTGGSSNTPFENATGIGSVVNAAEGAPDKVKKAIEGVFGGGKWEKLAFSIILLFAGAVLAVYGIMVAVRPRESALSIPIPKAVPLPVPV
jgi:hypothetical protein